MTGTRRGILRETETNGKGGHHDVSAFSVYYYLDGRIIIIRTYSCPASTISTTLSVRRSMPSGSYFLVRLAPNSMANA